jgi:chromosome segregation ATPase
VKINAIGLMACTVVAMSASSAIVSCAKEPPPAPTVSAAETAANQKAAADKAVAAKVASDKAAAEKASAQAKAETAALPTDLIEMKAEITRAMAQLDATMAKVEGLTTASGDLDKPTKDGLAAIETLDTETQAIKKRADEMRTRGAAYFEAWEKQLAAMSTPDVVAIATKRKDELSGKYAELLTAMQESRAALDAYWADMKPIRSALDDGLTPDKQKLLAPQVKSAKDKAATLKTRIDATFAKLNQVSLIYANH